jgi:predicted homoserine dehydrogenase-like protein
MIIVDSALKEREKKNDPVKVGIIGAGFMGRGAVLTIERSIPGMKVAALYNRTISSAQKAFDQAGVSGWKKAETAAQLDDIIQAGGYGITDNPFVVCDVENVDVIIEATGEIEFGARVTLRAIEKRKHVILMNAELDATVGPLLKTYADDAGVVLSNADGDQPGVIMNLFRFVETIGYKPVLAGNIKGLQDPYRTPETQKEFARKHKQKPKMVTSFADGTKISMEMAVVANGTGFRVAKRGMYGYKCKHVNEALELFSGEEMLNGGLVDYVLGAEPGPGVFIIGYNDHPIQQGYARYLKMGDGPFYLFYVPYHLPHLEVPLSAARAVLFRDTVVAPIGGPVCEVVTLAKKDLHIGEKIDGIGGFTCYGTIENSEAARSENLLPMGLAENCTLINDVKKDQPLRFEDVDIPDGRFIDKLWAEQQSKFSYIS